MNKIILIVLALSLSGFFVHGADDKKPEKKTSKTLEKYDKNKNGKLDEEENKEMQKDRKEEAIKKYDKNGDGKLDDEEKAAATGKKPAKKKSEPKKAE